MDIFPVLDEQKDFNFKSTLLSWQNKLNMETESEWLWSKHAVKPNIIAFEMQELISLFLFLFFFFGF